MPSLSAAICPFAVQHPGPLWKTWPEPNVVAGIVLHDAGDGTLAGAFSELADVLAQKSWHFTIHHDGTTYQHYLLDDSCWHTGVRAFNARQVGVEHIRTSGQSSSDILPVQGAQLAASVRLARWIAEQAGWPHGLVRDPAGDGSGGVRTLWQHLELTNTTCPNGRIPFEAYTNLPPPPPEPVAPLSREELLDMFIKLGYGLNAPPVEVDYRWGALTRDADGEQHHELIVRGRP